MHHCFTKNKCSLPYFLIILTLLGLLFSPLPDISVEMVHLVSKIVVAFLVKYDKI